MRFQFKSDAMGSRCFLGPRALLAACFLCGHWLRLAAAQADSAPVSQSVGEPMYVGPNVTMGNPATTGGVAQDLNVEAFLPDQQLDELPCVPEDFVRMPGACTDNKVEIIYSELRRCNAAFQVESHSEPCGCRPDDYTWTYEKTTDQYGKEQCMQIYWCNSAQKFRVRTDLIHCMDNLPACKEDYLETMYGKCDYIRNNRTGEVLSNQQAVEVIYYFRSGCDPSAYGSVRVPASAFIPCDTKCGAGMYLKGYMCHKCKPGTYSLGGTVRYEHFESIDPAVFKTSCTYKRLVAGSTTQMETVNCTQGWYAEDFNLEVGQFDYINQWFPEECQADSQKDCHNNLEAVLSMSVDLVADGHVRFNFSVNSEKGHDGLSLYVDSREEPIMGLQSYVIVPKTVVFPLTRGRHTLSWVYSKDQHFTQGEDIAVISSIEIAGLALNAFECPECPPGFYSGAGASECSPCPVNSIAPSGGQPQCNPCAAGAYSLALPRVKCTPRPPCNLTLDATKIVSPCSADTRQQTISWVFSRPQVCQGGDALPPVETKPCEPCGAGFEEYTDPAKKVITCRRCGPGTSRSADQAACEACPNGTYSAPVWSLRTFDLHTGAYPRFMRSMCKGACGTSGWRVMSQFLDSGRHHGDGAQVFLIFAVFIEAEGSVWFNYSADMSAGPKKRGFFFYIDDNIMDFVQGDEENPAGPDEVKESGPWDLKPGRRKLVWEWSRVSGDAPPTARDNALIYDIVVRGSKFGVSGNCEHMPPGYQVNAKTKEIEPCEAGWFSDGGKSQCSRCPDNTISPKGSGECIPCGPGTTSNSGDSDCFIGQVTDANSFCSYFDTSNAPGSLENVTQLIHYFFYDLSPLNRMSLVRPFGPIREPAAQPGLSPAYYINICNRDTSNATCRDISGAPLNTYACMVHGEEEQQVGHQPAVDLGQRMELHSLAEYGPGLANHGVRLSFEGDKCPKTGQPRRMNVTLICSPASGYGTPSHWTADGKLAAFDPSRTTPRDWVQTGGAPLAIEDRNACFHDLVWYSKIACHECNWNDYDEVRVNDCKANKMYTYKWKDNLDCLPSERAPLPNDIECQPCSVNDYIEVASTCKDAEGVSNVTYVWSQPKMCSSSLDGAVALPRSVVAGPCIQEILLVPSRYLGPKYVFLTAILGVLLVIALTVALVAYLKHLKLKRYYAKLVESEQMAAELADMEDEDDEFHDGSNEHLNK